MDADVIVIGAGVSGLACAKHVHQAGRRVVVLDKARAVGGRCATRTVDGQPVDIGVAFFHGSDPAFLDALHSVEASVLEGWPLRRRGAGRPCQPSAFTQQERRLAYAQGVSAFPEALARGLDVRLGVAVESVAAVDHGLEVVASEGRRLRAKDVVLALPLEQSGELLKPHHARSDEIRAVGRLLQMIASLPCLTVIAGYAMNSPEPDWDLWYPEESSVVQLLSNDSHKRVEPRHRVLVIQALPVWSRTHFDDSPEEWAALLLAEAARIAGKWIAAPLWRQTHQWRYARVDRGSELSSPVLVSVPSAGRLGITGDVFAPGGGVQASWVAGQHLARRLLHEDSQS